MSILAVIGAFVGAVVVVCGIFGGCGGGGGGGGGGDTPDPPDDFSNVLNGKIIVLDPGHGLGYPGPLGADGEAAVVHNVSSKLKILLRNENATVYETPSDKMPSERAYFANGKNADILVSIHANGVMNVHVNGVESFYGEENYGNWDGAKEEDIKLCRKLHPYVVNLIPSNDRGILSDLSSVDHEISVLRYSDMPACLAEIEYISCWDSVTYKSVPYFGYRELLESPRYQDDVAQALFTGIKSYFIEKENPFYTNSVKEVEAMPEFNPIALLVVIGGGLFIIFSRSRKPVGG